MLDSIGYGDLQPELTRLSKAGLWQEMGQRIDDTLLNKLALVGEPGEIATRLNQRFGDVFDICTSSVFSGDAYSAGEFSSEIAGAIKQASS